MTRTCKRSTSNTSWRVSTLLCAPVSHQPTFYGAAIRPQGRARKGWGSRVTGVGEARQVYWFKPVDCVEILLAYLDDNVVTEQRYLVISHSRTEFSQIVYQSEAWSPYVQEAVQEQAESPPTAVLAEIIPNWAVIDPPMLGKHKVEVPARDISPPTAISVVLPSSMAPYLGSKPPSTSSNHSLFPSPDVRRLEVHVKASSGFACVVTKLGTNSLA